MFFGLAPNTFEARHRHASHFRGRLTCFVRCTCRPKRQSISHLLFDRFQHSPGCQATRESECGEGCDECAADGCAGTGHSTDHAPATRFAHDLLGFHCIGILPVLVPYFIYVANDFVESTFDEQLRCPPTVQDVSHGCDANFCARPETLRSGHRPNVDVKAPGSACSLCVADKIIRRFLVGREYQGCAQCGIACSRSVKDHPLASLLGPSLADLRWPDRATTFYADHPACMLCAAQRSCAAV
jgi:hypothetical protein